MTSGGEAKEIEPAHVIQQPWPEITQRDFLMQGSLSLLLRGNLWGQIVARVFSCLGCGAPSKTKRCETCEQARKTKQAGYSGTEYRRSRQQLLAAHPRCFDCAGPATVAHHHPPRVKLVAAGIKTPDAVIWLKPLCERCHDARTARGE